ncbi:MAG: hypothetical protein IJ410_09150 [Oscillospiraceae bacterium]|nr:hypothetical protein [Oscillospiraceae bacterium]
MTMFQVYAIAAPISAFIWCAIITFFLKNFHLKSHIRVIVTYVIYLMIAFAMSSGGNGLLNIDMSVFNSAQFMMYAVAGLCVCLGLYLFYERGNIGQKLEDRRNAKKAK